MSLIVDYFLKGGWVMWPILGLSIASLAIVMERAVRLRRARRQQAELVSRVLEVLRRHHGGPEWERKVNHAGSKEVRDLEENLSWLPTIANLATLLGLFGTVLGMVEVFQAIESTAGPADPRVLAGGIWTALITTVGGLTVAIPTLFAYHMLIVRVDHLAAVLKEAVEELHDTLAVRA